jgi:hypothetical protein
MSHDVDALDARNQESKSMVYRNNWTVNKYHSFPQIFDAMKDPSEESFHIQLARNSQNAPTIILSDLCVWISKTAKEKDPNKQIILFVLGCQVIPSEAVLATNLNIPPKKMEENITLFDYYFKALSLGIIMINHINTTAVPAHAGKVTETQEEYGDDGWGTVMRPDHAPPEDYKQSGWWTPENVWPYIARAAGIERREFATEEEKAEFQKIINSGKRLKDDILVVQQVVKIADHILTISEEAEESASKRARTGGDGGGGGGAAAPAKEGGQRRKTKRKTRQQVGCGTKQTKRKRTKRKRTKRKRQSR